MAYFRKADTGVYTLGSLPYGKFFLHEDKAPEGFVQDNIYYPFEIKEDGQIVNFETVPGKDFPNKPIKGTVTTTKVDATNPQHKLSVQCLKSTAMQTVMAATQRV